MSAKFNLGRLKSKNLILEVLSMTCLLEEAVFYLAISCRQLRKLVV